MRTITEVAEDIKSILNNIERTEECNGETLVDINELVDEILSINAHKQKIVYTTTRNPYLNQPFELDHEIENKSIFQLPCAVSIGEPIFVIPTITNFKLNKLNGFEENNRVYEQIVCNFVFTKYGCTINTCEGFCHVRGDDYGKTWFLTRTQAEAALKKMQEDKQ